MSGHPGEIQYKNCKETATNKVCVNDPKCLFYRNLFYTSRQAEIIKSIQSNYLFQILKLHMVLFKLEMILENNKIFYTEKNYTTKSNTI